MKPFRPTRRFWSGIAVLLATNIMTGLVITRVMRARDYLDMNETCLFNWGSVDAHFEDAYARTLLHIEPLSMAQTYRVYEDNARFMVHYPRYSHRILLDRNRASNLFCWAVAADKYRDYDVDIPVDPLVWHAFLTDGPKDLSVYWGLRQSLTDAGAGRGLIRGSNRWHHTGPKPLPYKMPRLSTPYHPLPGEDMPS